MSFGVLALLLALMIGCQSVPMPPVSYEALAQRAAAGEMIEPATLKKAFLTAPEFAARLRRLTALESQALDAMDGSPLRLGAVGSAILDQYYGSLAGHQALAKFYGHVEATEQALWHEAWVATIRDAIESTASVAEEVVTYVALSTNEAQAFLAEGGLTTVGTEYQVDQEGFRLWTAARVDGEPMQSKRFDLGELYSAMAAAVQRDENTVFPVGPLGSCADLGVCETFSTWEFVRVLAQGGDSAAQTFIGMEMLRLDRLDDAARWLYRAAQAENALANLTLADTYMEKARRSADAEREAWLERAERRFLLTISAGFDSAMYSLGLLYLYGTYGDEKVSYGEPLLVRATDLDNVDALLSLGWLHAEGRLVRGDKDLSERYFLRAAERDEGAKVQYARFLTHPTLDRELNDQAWRWLREVAKRRNPDAMLLVGELYARGDHVDKSVRRARSWFKSAVKAAPNDGRIVNQVAWQLTVSKLPGLRDERFALKIMDRLMADEDADARRNPAYLDTWAAAYAANGDFERAISVQQEAVDLAVATNDANLDLLRKHLSAFRGGQRIIEDVVP